MMSGTRKSHPRVADVSKKIFPRHRLRAYIFYRRVFLATRYHRASYLAFIIVLIENRFVAAARPVYNYNKCRIKVERSPVERVCSYFDNKQ